MMRKLTLLILPIMFLSTLALAGGDEKTDMATFLSKAIEIGLTNDQLSREVAEELLTNESNWSPKCTICKSVKKGFSAYLKSAPVDTLESELPRGVMEEFGDEDASPEDRKMILQEMVDRYVSNHFAKLEMTEEEEKAMRESLAKAKKENESANPTRGKCPSCEGANAR